MIHTPNQRWRSRRESYRPAGEVINTRNYEIAETRSDGLIKKFVELYDLGDRWTAGEVSDLIKSGYKVERVPVYEAVARLTEDRHCPKHPQPNRQPKQEALTL